MNVYEVITERIVGLLEKGEVPWRRPWGRTPPRNGEYGNAYRGINAFMLNAAGHANPNWLTFRQAIRMGGNVRKGERGLPVVKWIFHDEDADEGKKGRGRPPTLLYFTVFNVEQCEGLDMARFADPAAAREHAPVEDAERVVAGMPKPPPRATGDRASWNVETDVVTMPPAETFRSAEAYYRTLFHELVHSTAHATRLARREGPAGFGSEGYGREELVAEMGAAFLAGAAGVDGSEGMEQSAAYVRGWLKAIRDDPRAVVIAAAQAQKAADWILGRKFEDKGEAVAEAAVAVAG